MTQNSSVIDKDLADLLRERQEEIAQALTATCPRLYPHCHGSEISPSEARDWALAEITELVDALESGDVSDIDYRYYRANLINQSRQSDFSALTNFVETRFFLSRVITPIIWNSVQNDPRWKVKKALESFELLIERIIKENLAIFSADVLVPGGLMRTFDTEALDAALSPPYVVPDEGQAGTEQRGAESLVHEESGDTVWTRMGRVAVVLSSRELEVVRLVAAGHSNGEIAAELNLARNTVKNHIGHLLDKLQMHNRTELAVHAMREGWTASSGS